MAKILRLPWHDVRLPPDLDSWVENESQGLITFVPERYYWRVDRATGRSVREVLTPGELLFEKLEDLVYIKLTWG